MSRVGKKPVTVPKGVTVSVKDGQLGVKGPKGELKRPVPPLVQISVGKEAVDVSRQSDEGGGEQEILQVRHGCPVTEQATDHSSRRANCLGSPKLSARDDRCG